ncbi:unnamed protein product [Rotaria sordida]|uniref:SAM dependent carboxyl methyltransferase n=1 Tax=Rotaria sordida TaxID=392033 RepID=A0A814WTB4_9BILA|nr:unnamed protein product [Rotaria sordida]CAF3939789.1 unnamed protein product [Rotaria sordida]
MDTKSGTILGMTGSYNSNSVPQLNVIQSSIPFIQKAIDVLDIVPSFFPIMIADFGSSHGANSNYAMKIIINYIKQIKQTNQSFLIIHNDLPTNDWISLFDSLNEDKTYFGLANGRSFYEQCLPTNSLTIAYSSMSIHWLSRKPCNLSNHCLPRFAQGAELIAFKTQAANDYAQFLENRSRELMRGGVLILTILSADKEGKTLAHNVNNHLYKCAQLIPLNEQELLDYTIPLYHRTYEECLNEELFKRCSLQLIESDFHIVESKFDQEFQQGKITLEEFLQMHIGYQRSWGESILRQALEMNEKRSKEEIDQVLDRFWSIYKDGMKENSKEYKTGYYQTYLVLKKL